MPDRHRPEANAPRPPQSEEAREAGDRSGRDPVTKPPPRRFERYARRGHRLADDAGAGPRTFAPDH